VRIRYERETAKQIKNLDKATKVRILSGIEQLPGGDIKKLEGYNETFRLRIGKYRILYAYDQGDIVIKSILTRGSAYK